MSEEKKSKLSFLGFITPIRVLIFIIIIGLLATAGYFFVEYQKTQELLKNPNLATERETEQILLEVSKIYKLPEEKPTIATVKEKEKLSDQKFFAQAANGDKVLLFENAKKAIIYRPSTRQIIEVGPINISDQEAGEVVPTEDNPVTIDILNGTTVNGLTSRAQSEIEADKSLFIVVDKRDNASKRDYAQSLIVDSTGKNKTTAEKIAKILGGKVGSMPEDEEFESSSSILIILGSSYASEEE